MLEFEQKYYSQGKQLIAGIDEVGRGPLCGPVVAASVILPKDIDIPGLTDSKKLTPKKRDILYIEIKKKASHIGLGIIHEDRIDDINILEATLEAMRAAISDMDTDPDMLLVDGNMKPLTNIEQESIVRGDSKSLSIAAASVVAKVKRDRMMGQYGLIYPGYGLERNMGYGSKEHIDALKNIFSTPIHRKSFNPVSKYLPRLKDIKDRIKLKRQIVATDLIKKGHEILDVRHDSSSLDILTRERDRVCGFTFSDHVAIVDIEREARISLSLEKDISSSINISVISVEFSKKKPIIKYRKYD